MKRRKSLSLVILGLLLCLCIPVYADEPQANPTQEEQTYSEGFHDIDGVTYYFYADGTKPNGGTPIINGKKYCFRADGSVIKGWFWLKEDWKMYCEPNDNGAVAMGLYEVEGEKYLFDPNGLLYIRSRTDVINGKKYWFQSDGSLKTGWSTLLNWVMYFDPITCQGATGFTVIDGNRYYFNSDGVRFSACTPIIDGKKYAFDGDGIQIQGWYWLTPTWNMYFDPNQNGAAATGIYQVEDKRYLFDNNGLLYIKSRTDVVNGKKYWFQPDGSLATGWQTLGNWVMYFWPDECYAATGWQVIDGTKYYFNKDGVQTNGPLIAIDAGHQRYQNRGKEPVGPGSSQMKQKVSTGTQGVATGVPEYQLNLTVSLKLKQELLNRGYDVYMIRETNDVNISNAERAQRAAKAGAEILVRIHANGDSNSSVQGAMTMAPDTNNPFMNNSLISASQNLSQKIINSFCAATGAKNLGVQLHNDMTGINWSTIPVTIVEMGFMSNRSEDRLMATDAYQNKMVKGIADGIEAYYGT